ncbi:MAG: septal ring lytic transglycosylase RlpA family protein [Deltaproteobacteria bacterium]|nr:MAG: septal ring lytic transglycosylase RlpA family protein [Deltaproteobacteria bacterium]
MIKSAVRFLPAVASMLLMAGAAQAQVAARGAPGWEESGQATWYGGRHNGRRTSSGEIFNQEKMTAAHPSLPLGSRIRVTMQETGASVVVVVNDRQPPSRTRVIDLSRGAAARIGLLAYGKAMVTLGPVGHADEIEVAEAPFTASQGMTQGMSQDAMETTLSDAYPRRHGPRHTRRGARVASAARPYYHAPSVTRVRHSAPHRAARHRL